MNILKDVFTYAFRGSGKFVFLTITILWGIVGFSQYAGILGLIAQLFLFGYMAAIYFQLISSTAVGDANAPEFPDSANLFGDILVPLLKVFLVYLISYLPVFVAHLTGFDSTPILFFLNVFGSIYFPMAMMAVVVCGYLGAASPLVVIPAILRSGKFYLLLVGLTLVTSFTQSLLSETIASLHWSGFFFIGVAFAWMLMTNARLLGLIYREKQNELGWFA